MSLSTLDNNHWLWSSGDIDPGLQTDIVLGAKFLFVWPVNFVDQTEGCPRVHILSEVPDPDIIWSVHVISRYFKILQGLRVPAQNQYSGLFYFCK